MRRSLGALGAVLGLMWLVPSTGLAAVPYPAPTQPTAPAVLPKFEDGLALAWKFGPSTTRLLSGRIAVTGPDVTLVALYRRPGRYGALLWQITADGQSEVLATVLQLERHTYVAGNKLQLTLAVPNARAQVAVFTFRHGQIPTTRVSYPAP